MDTQLLSNGRPAERLDRVTERGTPRSRRAAVTKERIVQAAASAFDQRGYLGVNLNDVVMELGLTKGALYYFFPAKEDLAIEIVRRHFAASESLAEEVSSAHENKLDALIEISRRLARTFQSDPITRAGSRLATERILISVELPQPFVDWIDRIARLIRMAKSRGQVPAHIKPRALAEVLVAFFFGADAMSADLNDRRTLPAKVDQFWELLLPCLRP